VKSILAVADEVDEILYTRKLKELKPDIVVACGDLPFDYLEYLVTVAAVPLVYVPGNHDPDLSRKRPEEDVLDFVQPFGFRALPSDPAGPKGCINADRRVVESAGLRIAGLGGSKLYNFGPNQFTEAQMRRRTLSLELRSAARRACNGGSIDILLTHAPPLGVGDQDDLPHQGFESFHRLVDRVRPTYLIHGHIHPHGGSQSDRHLGDTIVVNAIKHRMLEVDA
jgi:predicted phosphodiesterase